MLSELSNKRDRTVKDAANKPLMELNTVCMACKFYGQV